MKIAILGWGSLLWEQNREFDRWRKENWSLDGPTLPLEFSRVSTTRDGALTLVIDCDHGEETQVAWCFSTRKNVEDAAADLRCREGTVNRFIKHICLPDDQERQGPERTIVEWAKEKKLDAVVWTALPSNFKEFSLSAAITHLQNLTLLQRPRLPSTFGGHLSLSKRLYGLHCSRNLGFPVQVAAISAGL